MSRYSGKCDVCDSVEIMAERNTEYWKSISIYIGSPFDDEEDLEVEINRPQDIVPFYPFLTRVLTSSGGKTKMWISNKSYITYHNEEMLNSYKDQLLKIKQRCNRKGLEFDPKEGAKRVSMFEPHDDIYELSKRISLYGKKASIEGLVYSPIINWYREAWISEMIKWGTAPDVARYWALTH